MRYKTIPLEKSLFKIKPKLAKEWHHTKNGDLTPKNVASLSSKKIWWICKKGHIWQAKVSDRTYHSENCPYCSGRKVCNDNCLATINPELTKEWHPTKNGKLTPNDFTKGSTYKAWWKCKKNHQWQDTIGSRSNGSKCPYCYGHKVCKDNCLATINPELAKEWHSTKNKELTPNDVIINSSKKVWWICKKHHEWYAKISNRSNKGCKCPFCSGVYVCKDNNLAIVNPKLAKEWHPTKNGKLTPNDFTSGSAYKVWWKCKKGHEWEAIISSRSRGARCPYCSGHYASKDNWLATSNPNLAREWHPTKNGKLTPKNLRLYSNKKVWWKCHKGHEWLRSVISRSKGSMCPGCKKELVKDGYYKRS